MSEKTKAILGTVVSLLVAVLAVASEWQDMGGAFTTWALRGVALLTVLSNVLGLKVVSFRRDPGKAAGAAALLLGALLLGAAPSGCSASPAVVATHGTMRATQLTGDTIAAVHKAGKADCVHVKRWRTHGRQAVRLAIAGTVVAIKAQKDPDYLSLLKPGACELFRWLDAAAKDAPAEAAKAMAYMGSFKALVCPKGKTAAGVAAILGVVLDAAQRLFAWLHEISGSTDNKLIGDVDKWLADEPSDATDSICLE